MLLRFAALLLAGLVPGQPEDPAPLVRLQTGTARLAEGAEVRALEHGTALRLRGEAARVEAGARSEIEVVWHGLASARVTGPTAFDVRRRPGLVLADFQVAEIEVRRGTAELELAGLGPVEIGVGVLQARMLAGGLLELRNRGGAPLALRRAGSGPLEIPPGQRIRLRVSA